MGLDPRTADFLLWCREQGCDFSRTLTLGRQSVKMSPEELAALRRRTGVDLAGKEHAERFFEYLGAVLPESMDASAYEGATVIHNLNEPAPPELLGRYSCVVDGGTLEHLFDFPTALATSLRLVRVGGHFLTCTAANNLMGHGFYQFSPELFWNVLSPGNGFTVAGMFLHAEGGWYAVANPAQIGARVQAATMGETFLYVAARKTAEIPLWHTAPHQSDYVGNLGQQGWGGPPAETGWKARLVQRWPLLGRLQRWWRWRKFVRETSLRNRRAFTELGRHLPRGETAR